MWKYNTISLILSKIYLLTLGKMLLYTSSSNIYLIKNVTIIIKKMLLITFCNMIHTQPLLKWY